MTVLLQLVQLPRSEVRLSSKTHVLQRLSALVHRSKTQCFKGRLGIQPVGTNHILLGCWIAQLLDAPSMELARSHDTNGQSFTAKGHPIFATGDLWKSK
jgi:hypothetical protein